MNTESATDRIQGTYAPGSATGSHPSTARPSAGRWIAVLPTAVGGSWLALFLVDKVLAVVVGDADTLPIVGRIVAFGFAGLACGSVGVALGVTVAPAAKGTTALALGVLYALCCGYALFPILQQEEYTLAYFGVVTASSALLTTSVIRDAVRDTTRLSPPAVARHRET